ncbi:MAG: glutamine--fructose-6-phosphate transaminase (isomerizing) [Patescibacteria group bacterium]
MCGIFGYIGESRDAGEAVVEGLRRLDYRGYDSWGVAVLKSDDIALEKSVGVVDEHPLPFRGHVGIGHTRWATHGAVTEANAHPHMATDGSFALAHNGIVENMEELKNVLAKKGYRFLSQTDTEAIVYLIEEKWKKAKTLQEAVRTAFKELEGRNTVIVLSSDGHIIGARNGSPLVIGVGARPGEIYFSSDVLSFSSYVKGVVVLENGQMAATSPQGLSVIDIASGKKLKPKIEKNVIVRASSDKGKYEHYMLKEIMESPEVIQRIAAHKDTDIRKLARAITKARRVYTIGSGTAGAAAGQFGFYLREYGGIPALGLIGAEATEYYGLFGKGDLLIALSQSGETADVLEVLEFAQKKGATIASYVNMPGSMITRMSDFKYMAEAGPEICVMSTKIFTSQIAWGYLIAKAVQGRLAEGKKQLKSLVQQAEKLLADEKKIAEIKSLAPQMAQNEHLFLLAKGQNLQIAREAMVKIIEGSYIHAHAIPAGDLKHYAITLMEPGVPVVAIVSNDALRSDVLNAIHEVKARGAFVTGVAPSAAKEFDQTLLVPDTKETSAIMNIIPLQLLAYYMAVHLGTNVDKPRNIAKSVTVK